MKYPRVSEGERRCCCLVEEVAGKASKEGETAAKIERCQKLLGNRPSIGPMDGMELGRQVGGAYVDGIRLRGKRGWW